MSDAPMMGSRLYAMLDELEANPRVEILDLWSETSRWEPDDLDIEDYWLTIQRLAGVALDPRMRGCFIGNRVRVSWRARESTYEDAISGELILHDLNHDAVWQPGGHHTQAELGAVVGGCYSGETLMQFLEVGTATPAVWTDDWDSRPRRMTLDYPDYLEMTLLTRGAQPWPLLFCDEAPSMLEDAEVARRIDQMLDELPRVFPESRFDALTARLEAVRGCMP